MTPNGRVPPAPPFPGRLTLIAAALLVAACSDDGARSGADDPPGTADRIANDGAAAPGAEADASPPDVMLVVSDDMRWDAMSNRGHPFLETPNFDALTSEATTMENAFVPIALCSPSRAAILTGREPHLASAPRIVWRNNSFLDTQTTVAEDLQDAGYETAYFGKWHLGDGSIPKRGFDHWESFDWLGDFFDPTIVVNGEPMEFEGYADDVIVERAERWLASRADSERPVFVVVGLKAPHLQFEHPERHATALEGVGIPKPDTYEEDFAESGKLQSIKDWLGMDVFHCGLKCFGGEWDTYIKYYYRAILGLDDSIGSLRAALRHRGREDRTLFVYTSDNGYSLGDHGLTEKHFVYEEPIRVPFVVDVPGDADAGLARSELVSTIDIVPTVLDYAGVAIPERVRGRSLRPLVEAPDAAAVDGWRDELFFMYEKAQIAVRTERYKYIESLTVPGHVELYDLELDPRETRTVHADPDYADTLAGMEARLRAITAENGWSARGTLPVGRALVSSPVPTADAERLGLATSLGPAPTAGALDANGLLWRELDAGPTGAFAFADGAPEDASVLVALPIERTVDWDPMVEIVLPREVTGAMYVGGERKWDDFEPRPIDVPNPPLAGPETLVVMRLDGTGPLTAELGIESPSGTVRLPLEDRTLGTEAPELGAAAPARGRRPGAWLALCALALVGAAGALARIASARRARSAPPR